jgi:hypothetical protein
MMLSLTIPPEAQRIPHNTFPGFRGQLGIPGNETNSRVRQV